MWGEKKDYATVVVILSLCIFQKIVKNLFRLSEKEKRESRQSML